MASMSHEHDSLGVTVNCRGMRQGPHGRDCLRPPGHRPRQRLLSLRDTIAAKMWCAWPSKMTLALILALLSEIDAESLKSPARGRNLPGYALGRRFPGFSVPTHDARPFGRDWPRDSSKNSEKLSFTGVESRFSGRARSAAAVAGSAAVVLPSARPVPWSAAAVPRSARR